MRNRRQSLAWMSSWALIVLALIFLYGPLLPPIVRSFSGLQPGDSLFANYQAILADTVLARAALNSLIVALVVAIVAPLFALLAAQAVRTWRVPRLIIGIVLLPLFIPGVSMGVATALFFRQLGIEPSILTMI